MKLIIAIVSRDDSASVMRELVKHRHFVTKLSSTGGFLRRGNTTLMLGVKNEDVDSVVNLIAEHSKVRREIVPNAIVSEFGMVAPAPIEVNVGGATLFIVDIEKMHKF